MKYYESTFEEYISSVEKYNLHPELEKTFSMFPKHLQQFENIIFYGCSGIGKYSQVLYLLKKYSPSELKYAKKITAQTDKHNYTYNISDIHYEIDMSLLGCNSKSLWNEIFLQIIDIVSVKTNKIGIIVCKNFHLIHSELLEIFYSYMQQYSCSNLIIKFILITEHIGFIPDTIVNYCHTLRIKKPSQERFKEVINLKENTKPLKGDILNENNIVVKTDTSSSQKNRINKILHNIKNIKQMYYYSRLTNENEVSKDILTTVCDNIISSIVTPDNNFTAFRDKLYDILTYNLDMNECLWYIIIYFIENNNKKLTDDDITEILMKTYFFFKYFNNNYRPIFHLESIMYYIINKYHGL